MTDNSLAHKIPDSPANITANAIPIRHRVKPDDLFGTDNREYVAIERAQRRFGDAFKQNFGDAGAAARPIRIMRLRVV